MGSEPTQISGMPRGLVILITLCIAIAGLLFGSIYVFSEDDAGGGLAVNTPEKSNLIVDCTFGFEKGEDGKPKENCGFKHVFQLANNIMKLLIWLAITGAGVLIFYKGAKLAVNVFIKGGDQAARTEVQNALKATLWGLILILSAYLIVRTGFQIIGYNLNGGDPFVWNEKSLKVPKQDDPTPPPGSAVPPSQTDQNNRQNQQQDQQQDNQQQDRQQDNQQNDQQEKFAQLQNSGISHKPPGQVCSGTNCYTAKKLLDKLKSLSTTDRWWVTEACPPTQGHRHSCHRVEHCDCVDINFLGANGSKHNPTKEEVARFIREANAAGLYAVYEIPTSGFENLQSNIPAGAVQSGNTQVGKVIHINLGEKGKPHFSIYESKAVHDRKPR